MSRSSKAAAIMAILTLLFASAFGSRTLKQDFSQIISSTLASQMQNAGGITMVQDSASSSSSSSSSSDTSSNSGQQAQQQPQQYQQQPQQYQQQPQQSQQQPQQSQQYQQQPQQYQQQPQQSQPQPQQAPQVQQAPQSQASGAPDSTDQSILDLHNQLRAQHHAPPLTWSNSLQASAQNWANNLANSCTFYHSGPGENMASGYNSWQDVIYAFYNEINQYDFNNPGYSAATGHATQLLWKASSQLGCATARNSGCSEGTIFVCHYDPVGNVNAPQYFRDNVLPK